MTVSNDLELEAALTPCPEKSILLKNGSYSEPIRVCTGVHLMGESRDGVVLKNTLTVEAGATGVTLETFTLAGSLGTALLLEEGAAVTARDLSIESPALYGIFASASTALTLEGVTVMGSGGPGIWTTCGQEDCCSAGAARPSVSLTDTTIGGAHLAGLGFFGSDVKLQAVTVSGTLPGPQGTSYSGLGGGGLTVADCSDVKYGRALRIEKSATYGALFDRSTGALGDEAAAQGDVTIADSGQIGFWAQSPPAGAPSEPWFQLSNAFLMNNKGVGLGVAGLGNPGDEKGAIICKVQIGGVPMKKVPTLRNGVMSVEDVGDGFFWKGQANVMELDMLVSGSERQAVLIDGPVPQLQSDKITVDLGSGNMNNTVLQQNVTAGEELMDVPMLQATAMEILAGAVDLSAPVSVVP